MQLNMEGFDSKVEIIYMRMGYYLSVDIRLHYLSISTRP